MATYIVDACDKCGRAIAAGPIDQENLQVATFSLTMMTLAACGITCGACQGDDSVDATLDSSRKRFRMIVDADLASTGNRAEGRARAE
jgi:hypothetical protein